MRTAIDELIASYRQTGVVESDGLAMLIMARDPDTGRGMTDEQLRDEVINLLVAGTEAPGTTLAWLFHELGRTPDVEQPLVDELTADWATRPRAPLTWCA